MTSRFTLRPGGTAEVTAMHSLLVEVYADAYAHRVATGNPFASPGAFAERLERHRARPGFSWVGAWSDGELVGYAYGQRPDARYWLGDELADEREPLSAMRLFVTNELMVRQAWRDQGVGRLLHDALVDAQQEVTHLGLYVRPDNEPAVHLYTRLGYERIGPRQLAYEGSPLFDVMVRVVAKDA